MGVFQYADYLAQALYSPGKPIKFPNVIQNLEQADQQLRLLGTAASLLLTAHDSLHRRLGSAPVNADAISEELEHMHSLIFKGKWDKDGKHYVRTFSSDEERDTVNRAFHVLADAYGFKHERFYGDTSAVMPTIKVSAERLDAFRRGEDGHDLLRG